MKLNLPFNLIDEKNRYMTLYDIGSAMTTTGSYTYISSTSSVTYSTSTSGQYGVYIQLQNALAPYLISNTDFNNKQDIFYALTTGSANTYTVTMSNVTTYSDILNKPIYLQPNVTNTGASTLQINSLTALNIKYVDSTGTKQPLLGGYFTDNSYVILFYDGTDLVLNQLPVSNATQSNTGIVQIPVNPTSGNSITSILTSSVDNILLSTTSATTVATYTPSQRNNFLIGVYLRVITATTNATVSITYTDDTGAQTNTMLSTQALTIGSYSLVPLFINATTGSAINVNITAGTANQIYASVSIQGV